MVDKTAQIPKAWSKAIIVLIYKKGDTRTPGSYRLVSLLSIIGKMYAKHLLSRLLDWIEVNNILGLEQVGFRKGKSILDHCMVLSHLISKQLARANGQLFVAFLDLKGAFDTVVRDILWRKLSHMGMDRRLLILIRKLYTDNSCQVRVSLRGNLSEPIR